jgi:YbbR domain-containing protein
MDKRKMARIIILQRLGVDLSRQAVMDEVSKLSDEDLKKEYTVIIAPQVAMLTLQRDDAVRRLGELT